MISGKGNNYPGKIWKNYFPCPHRPDGRNADPDTRNFTGTVVCMYDNEMYKIRVQRPDKTNWRSKRLDDANLREYKQIMKEIDAKKERAEELVAQLAIDHPKCVNQGFTIAFLNK